jgi:palmitoyltransferase ZDHHC13/17
VNRKDNEGFTAIHYAVFRGNANLAFLLEEHGADIYAINKQGLTVLHIAAQGDSPVLMVLPSRPSITTSIRG